MKGQVFTEFLDMVESGWSLDMVDRLLERAGVAGAYTSVGNYPPEQFQALLEALAKETGTSLTDVTRQYGSHLFCRLAGSYPGFLRGTKDGMQFLADIEATVHAEVRKLYPDADLPRFDVEAGADVLTLTYYSKHPFADLVHGLIEGCLMHFGDRAQVTRVAPPEGSGASARFVVRREAA